MALLDTHLLYLELYDEAFLVSQSYQMIYHGSFGEFTTGMMETMSINATLTGHIHTYIPSRWPYQVFSERPHLPHHITSLQHHRSRWSSLFPVILTS